MTTCHFPHPYAYNLWFVFFFSGDSLYHSAATELHGCERRMEDTGDRLYTAGLSSAGAAVELLQRAPRVAGARSRQARSSCRAELSPHVTGSWSAMFVNRPHNAIRLYLRWWQYLISLNSVVNTEREPLSTENFLFRNENLLYKLTFNWIRETLVKPGCPPPPHTHTPKKKSVVT